MLGQEEAVNTARIHEHLLNRFPLEYIFVDLVLDPAPASVLKPIKLSLPNEVTALGKDPKSAVLHLRELKLILRDHHVFGGWSELENVLDVALVGLESVHVVKRVLLIIVVCCSCGTLWFVLNGLLSDDRLLLGSGLRNRLSGGQWGRCSLHQVLSTTCVWVH